MKPRAEVTIQIRGRVQSVDDAGFVLTIGTQQWPVAWPEMRSCRIPTVGEYVAVLAVPLGRPARLDLELVSWTPARVPVQTRGGAKE